MESGLMLQANFGALSLTWISGKSFLSSKLLGLNPVSTISSMPIPITRSSSPHSYLNAGRIAGDVPNSAKHTTLLVDCYHHHQRLKALCERLGRKGSCPLHLLEEDGDWSGEDFWAVIRVLERASRVTEILPVFNQWKSMERSRTNEFNYGKIIRLLSEQGMTDEATSALRDMRCHGLNPFLEIYNSIIHGYANKGKFHDALLLLSEMKEINLSPNTGTYDGLIEAYGRYGMYDEISMCLKMMKLENCAPDHMTYNLLIRVYSKGGLLKRMESAYQSMMSRRMRLVPATLLAMLEAYVDFGILERMEKIYRRVLNLRIPLDEDLVRKIAAIYIENHMYSRLYNLGQDLYFLDGVSNLVWCLLLLSYACLLSQEGIESILKKMEETNVSWSVTVTNIVLLFHLKLKNLKQMNMVLSRLTSRKMKFDIVTVGIVYDSNSIGFDGFSTIEMWRRKDLLNTYVEMNTDALVFCAFGKGHFLRCCEEAYISLDPEAREGRAWTYNNLIDLVVRYNMRQP